MILQHAAGLHSDIEKIGCEYLAVLAAIEIATDDEIAVEQANNLWTDLVYAGAISDTKGLCYADSYRRTIDAACDLIRRPSICGDMVADVLDGLVSFYTWWHFNDFTHVLERVYLQDGTPHTVLRGKRWQLLYNSVPGLDYGHHRSAHLLWIGPRGNWIEKTA